MLLPRCLCLCVALLAFGPASAVKVGHVNAADAAAELTGADVLRLAQLLRAAASDSDHDHAGHDHDHDDPHDHGHHNHHHDGGSSHNKAQKMSVAGLLPETGAPLSPEQLQSVVGQLLACVSTPGACVLTDTGDDTDSSSTGSGEQYQTAVDLSGRAKALAAALLFLETVAGLCVPIMLRHLKGHMWWLSLLNAFAGGIFLSAGLMHLIPHCEEAQVLVDLTRWGLPSHFPAYLLLICLGYLLVFCVERVMFEGHGHGHDHAHSHGREHQHLSRGSSYAQLDSRGVSSPGSSPDDDPMFGASGLLSDQPASSVRKRRSQRTSTVVDLYKPASPSCTVAGACDCGETDGEGAIVTRSLPLLLGMSVHTALECMALGLMHRPASFWVLFTAIAAHKGISALALASKFIKEGASVRQVVLLVGPFTLVAPTSIAAGHWAGHALPAALILLLSCLAAGTFLYVGAAEILVEEFEGDVRGGRRDISKPAARAIKFSAVLLAVACIALLGLMPHAH